MTRSSRLWLSLHLGLGLGWIALLASRAPGDSGIGATGPQVFTMLVSAGWLPSWALAFSLYLPLFFFNVAWFLPLALLPRGVLSELLARRWLGPRS